MNITSTNKQSAAIVCSHIALENLPVLGAIRTEPAEPEDSGWQFLCCCGKEEKESEAQIWLIGEVLAYEPTLLPFIDTPAGTKFCRSHQNSAWQKAGEM